MADTPAAPASWPSGAAEIHHRVKNNLQTVASLLRLQMRRVPSPAAQEALAAALGRIEGMALVHDLLSREPAEEVPLPELVGRLLDNLVPTHLLPGQEITRSVSLPEETLPADRTTPLLLCLNEMITNALRHGFRGRPRGHISVLMEETEGARCIVVEDDGIGPAADPAENLGLRVVRSLARDQLGADFRLERVGDCTRAVLALPSR